MGKTAAIALSFISSSCALQTELPPPLDTSQSALLIVQRPAEDRPVLRAVPQGEPLPPLVAEDGTSIYVLAFDGPLSERGLGPGEIEARPGRPLPSADRIRALVTPSTDWAELDALPSALANLQIAQAECSSPGACRRWFDGEPICDAPCPSLFPVEAPAPPTAPSIGALTCPEGWTATSSLASGCAPPSREASCPVGWWQPLSSSRCEPLRTCPTERWREPSAGLPPPVYVDAAAAPGGDGSASQPFSSLDEAVAAAASSPAATITLASGEYALRTALTDGLHLLGTCPEQVSLTSPLVVPRGVAVSAEGIRLSTGPSSSARVEGQLTLTSVAIETQRYGVEARAGSATVLDTVDADCGLVGVWATSGEATSVQLTQVTLRGSQSAAVRMDASGTLTLDRVALVFSRGTGIFASSNARVMASNLWVETSLGLAFSFDQSAAFTGMGVFGTASSGSILRRASTMSARSFGLVTRGFAFSLRDNARVSLQDARIRFTGIHNAISLSDESAIELSGVRAVGQGGTLLRTLDRTTSRWTDLEAAGFRVGAELFEDSQLTVRAADLDAPIHAGATSGTGVSSVLVASIPQPCRTVGAPTGSSQVGLDVEDLIVRDDPSVGIALCAGTLARLRRVEIRGAGVGILGECRLKCADPEEIAEVALTDLRILGGERTQMGVLQRGGTVRLDRADIRDVRMFGLYVWGSQGSAQNLRIDGVREGTSRTPLELDVYCSENRAFELRGPGSAVMTEAWTSDFALVRGDLTLERFRLRRAECAGITMGVDGSFVAANGEIAQNLRGLNFIRLSNPTVGEDVVFRDNAQGDVYRILEQP